MGWNFNIFRDPNSDPKRKKRPETSGHYGLNAIKKAGVSHETHQLSHFYIISILRIRSNRSKSWQLFKVSTIKFLYNWSGSSTYQNTTVRMSACFPGSAVLYRLIKINNFFLFSFFGPLCALTIFSLPLCRYALFKRWPFYRYNYPFL